MKRVLLDENLPKQLKGHFSSEFEVTSVPDLGWQSKKNGDLLASMSGLGIQYLLTADRNLRFQQNLDRFPVVVVVVTAHDIRLKNLIPHVAEIEKQINIADDSEKIIEIDLRT